MKNVINWFDIPTIDLERASVFYSKILDKEVAIQDFGGLKIATLSSQ